MRGQTQRRSGEAGFTLIEVAVAMIVLSILAAIAIPVFAHLVQGSRQSHSVSALKNGANAAESWAITHLGGYDSMTYFELEDEGYKDSEGVRLDVVNADGAGYCLVVTNENLPASSEWRVSTYDSSEAKPSTSDACPIARRASVVARQAPGN